LNIFPYLSVPQEFPEHENGKFWMKLKISEDIQLFPRYVKKPPADEENIVLKGEVNKGTFNSNTTGRLNCQEEDGRYWAKLQINSKTFISPDKNSQPKKSGNKILLFGNVENNKFKSYIYECSVDLEEGKFWLVIDYDPESLQLIRAETSKPEVGSSQMVMLSTVDEEGNLVVDVDKEFKVQTNQPSGKYYTVLTIEEYSTDLIKVENDPPKLDKGQKLVEGNVWVDKYTGEIRFDPKKYRDDHRHHAIDAITIALTEQGYLQRLSTFNAQRKEKQRQKLDSTENYPEPWQGFEKDVRESVNSILVSHRQDNRVLTKNSKGFSLRGQLHKDFVFGKRQAPQSPSGYHHRVKITELENNKHVAKVVDAVIRDLIEKHLEHNCNVDVLN
jgi:CRISPR-associated endonuclease Csn1